MHRIIGDLTTKKQANLNDNGTITALPTGIVERHEFTLDNTRYNPLTDAYNAMSQVEGIAFTISGGNRIGLA